MKLESIFLSFAFWLIFIITPALGPLLSSLNSLLFIPAYSFRLGIAFLIGVMFLSNKNLTTNWVIKFYFLIFFFNAFWGWNMIENNVPSIFQPDFWIYLLIGLLIILGYNRKYLTEIEKFLLRVLKVGIILNIVGIAIQPTFLRTIGFDPSLAYNWQVLLLPSIWFIFRMKSLSKFNRRVVIISFILMILEQIIFQKRLPLARILFIIMALSYAHLYIPIYGKKLNIVVKRYILYGFMGIILLTMSYTFSFGLETYVGATIDRFYISGEVSKTLEDDARWRIGEELIFDLERSDDLLFGRGFGGVVFGLGTLELDIGEIFRTSAEMGVSTILLKGGIVLLVFWIFVVIAFLNKFRLAKRDEISFSFWFVTLVFFVFLYVEGYFGAQRNIFHFIAAYGLGYSFSLNKNI